MTKWPSDKELERIRAESEHWMESRSLPPDASIEDRMKYSICKEFIIYERENKLTQRELAAKLRIDEALMSKILHYHLEGFTLDRLVRYYGFLFPKGDIKLLFERIKKIA